MAALADHLFAVASKDTARIQEAHILAGHMLCDWIEMDCINGNARRALWFHRLPQPQQTEGAR